MVSTKKQEEIKNSFRQPIFKHKFLNIQNLKIQNLKK
jgi:hypothetical protein